MEKKKRKIEIFRGNKRTKLRKERGDQGHREAQVAIEKQRG